MRQIMPQIKLAYPMIGLVGLVFDHNQNFTPQNMKTSAGRLNCVILSTSEASRTIQKSAYAPRESNIQVEINK